MIRGCEPYSRSDGMRSCDRCRETVHYDEQMWMDGKTGCTVCTDCAEIINGKASNGN